MAVLSSERARQAVRPGAMLVAAALVLGAVFSIIGDAVRHLSPAGELRFMRHIDAGPSATVTVIAKALSTLGSQSILGLLVVALCVLLVMRRRARVAAFTGIAAVGGLALSNAVKAIVDRPRPNLVHLVHVSSPSFPSGHATQTAAILPALAVAAAALGARRSTALAIAVVATLAVGASRVLLGVHYPSDVLAGWLLGGAWFAACYFVLLGDPPRYTVRA